MTRRATLFTTLLAGLAITVLGCGSPSGLTGRDGEGDDRTGGDGGGEDRRGGDGGDGSGGDGSGGDGSADMAQQCDNLDIRSISLSPDSSTVTQTGGQASPVTFTATATSGSGEITLDGDGVEWTVTREDDTDPGTIKGGTYQPNATAGGVITIHARYCGVEGTTTLTINLTGTVGTPSDPQAWSGTPVPGSAQDPAPTIIYPNTETRFPRNIYRTLFQWAGAGYTEFRMVFTGPSSTVTVYTDGVHPLCTAADGSAGCYEVDETAWSFIAGSNAGQTATVVVDALDLSGGAPVIRRSPEIIIGFSRRDVRGAVFYWSTTAAGIRRANIRDAEPENYLVGKPVATTVALGATKTDQIKCVACHTVSRNGKYLLTATSSQQTNSYWVSDVTRTAPPTPRVYDIANTDGHGFGTISPDDAKVVVAYDGNLRLVDRATGTVETTLDLAAVGNEGTHPDWSPDNTQMVFTTGKGDAPGDSAIAVVPWNGTAFGIPQVIVATDIPFPGETNVFPMFSPTGDFIAFSRGKGGHGDNTAQLFAVDKLGQTPVELTNANRMVNNQVTDGQFSNYQPTWAPPGDLDWVAFNSKRPYGVILGEGTQQIWVAAVDLAKVRQGEDGSFPAFRLQFQGLEEDNHRAFWVEDVRDVPPPDGGPGDGGPDDGGTPDLSTPDVGPDVPRQCVPVGMTCDPTLDTCCTSTQGVTYCDTRDDGETYTCIVIPRQG